MVGFLIRTVDNIKLVDESNLVSVVMCFLNGAAWIGEAIESVLQQNHPNWELILVDDGSNDGATEIARAYAEKHKQAIRYLEHPGHVNCGLTISRNAGIAVARGNWIAFLDADDCWFPGKLSADLRLFTLNPAAGMICQASEFWYSWADDGKSDVYVPVGVKPDELYPPFSLSPKLYPLGSGAPPCPSGIIVRKEVLKKVGGFEESFQGIFGLYEDQAFLAKIYLHEYVFVSGRANNLYRKHSGSMTDSLKDEQLYKTVRSFFLNWLQRYLSVHPEMPAAIRTLVSAAQADLNGPQPVNLLSRE